MWVKWSLGILVATSKTSLNKFARNIPDQAIVGLEDNHQHKEQYRRWYIGPSWFSRWSIEVYFITEYKPQITNKLAGKVNNFLIIHTISESLWFVYHFVYKSYFCFIWFDAIPIQLIGLWVNRKHSSSNRSTTAHAFPRISCNAVVERLSPLTLNMNPMITEFVRYICL